ncbi:protein of unknown function [Burkholderia multivorans]
MLSARHCRRSHPSRRMGLARGTDAKKPRPRERFGASVISCAGRTKRDRLGRSRLGHGPRARPNGGHRRRARSLVEQNAQHAAQRLGRAPQQLVADRERRQVFPAHRQLAQAADRHRQRARHLGRRQVAHRRFALVRHDLHPVVRRREDAVDLVERHVLLQLDRQRLRVAAHCADPHAQAVDRDRARLAHCRLAEDLVGFRAALPLFLRHAVAEILVDPRDQRAGERHAEVARRHRIAVHRGQHAAVDVEDRRRRIGELLLHRAVQRAHLRQQLAHVLRARARRGLVRHRRHPVDEVLAEQAAQRHQHQADRAVAADEVLRAVDERVLDHVQVDRIENDDRVVIHPQRRRRVDPVAVPARRAQLREHFVRVVAALAGDDGVALLQLVDVHRVLERSLVFRERRGLAARVAGAEKHRFDQVEIALFLHALHEDAADHAAPTYETYVHD